MVEEIIIFIGGCIIIGYIIYRQIKAQWYNVLLQKKVSGVDISKIAGAAEFDNMINETLGTIITNYEKHKIKAKEKESKKHDNMYQ